MATQITHLGTRLMWLALGAGPGIFHIVQGISNHSLGRSLEGVGMIFMGIAGFLQAGFIGSRPRIIKGVTQEDRAIGSVGLRNLMTLLGGAFILLGLLLSFVFEM